MNNKTPEDTLRDAHLKATIWKNEGDKGAYYNTELSRTYQDEKGNYHDTHSFAQGDLLKVAELARGAYGRINELKREQGQSKGSQETEQGNEGNNRDDEREAFIEQRQSQKQQARSNPTYDR